VSDCGLTIFSHRQRAATAYAGGMPGIVLSTVAFFVASFFTKRYLEDMGIPKGTTRATVVFVVALAVAYGVGFLVDRIWP
jgi:hypothetical protein